MATYYHRILFFLLLFIQDEGKNIFDLNIQIPVGHTELSETLWISLEHTTF